MASVTRRYKVTVQTKKSKQCEENYIRYLGGGGPFAAGGGRGAPGPPGGGPCGPPLAAPGGGC